jgi:type I restriction enzyme R subunit
MTSHQKLATLVLKSDHQAMSALTDVIYDLIRSGKLIDLDALSAAAASGSEAAPVAGGSTA